MKNKFNSVTTSALVVAVGMAVSTALADSSPANHSIQAQLSAVTAPELPAQAAKIVASASPDSLVATTESVITSAFNLKPDTMIAVASAIARQNPEVAATAAVEAATLQPKQTAWIARAVAGAAPGKAASIVEALCKAMPNKYAVIATAVAQAVPDSSSEILVAVGNSVPTLKAYISQANATYQGSSVGVVLAEVQRLIEVSLQMVNNGTSGSYVSVAGAPGTAAPLSIPLPPPVQKPPLTPPPSNPTQISHTNSVVVPPGGGRDYSGG